MASTGLQVMGLLLSIAGLVGGALVCVSPWWRVSAFVGDELVVSEVRWEGLWMTCLSHWGKIQCKAFDSGLALSASDQLCRTLSVLALILCVLALPVGVVGLKCTHCLGDMQSPKARLVQVAGILFVIAGVLFLIPVCWNAYVVVRDFYDPNVAPPLKRELGPALYLGWVMVLLMLVGGAVLYGSSTSPGVPTIFSSRRGVRNNPEASTKEDKAEKAYV
ncbi:claudin-9 [Electrophorus electricus]|uniref:Claudin n=1 Tax=Electrophorus electricus TaxID=8005 RepID=A0A4W4EYV8_ELEEL|nr:claudin-9 [Electrophorus electricus]